ncbi:DNA topoisomerase II [Scheffersomyces xylosifermentans]|uniref:DNA topoisomerase II n=1 Tax=Scheffersomyces xylosifermentans TaxID=1304137 RepID=UPI00315DD3CF
MSDFEEDESMDSYASGSDFSDGSDDFIPDNNGTGSTKNASNKAKAKPKKAQKPLSESTNTTVSSSTSRSTTPKPGGKQNASETYQKLSQLEHILKRPDTYIGSVEKTSTEMWCFDAESESMVFKEVSIVPGLYKIFDEILVNAADNKIRDSSMKNIRVKIDAENNTIEVMNDGKGIPVEIHEKEKIYIPELIFGHLLTSSNYDDDEKKVTGGRNGYGAKLCNIFSTEFSLETADLSSELLYKQTWSNNMANVTKPKITKLKSKKEYTKITFKPDLAKFGMDSLDEEILSVLRRRVYDLCGTVRDCNVYLNDKKLNIRNFKSYVEMYVNAIKKTTPEIMDENGAVKNYTTIVHEVFNDRWELAFAVSDGSFNQVSFVNSIATTAGGTHVKYVSDQIITKLVETMSKKEKGKKKLMIKPQEVRNNMFLFLNCLIENPAFTSQTKEQLTTRVTQFGGKPSEKLTISDQFIAKMLKTSIVDRIRDISTANEDKALQKADGSKKSRIKGQVKLVDANKAGTREGNKCTLILTEGDSALSLAVSGLAVVGRDYYGCFPLRGKLLNVREASADQISKNAEINALKQIIGLQHKKVYTVENAKTLRYGHVMIMTDQDQDGSHIKGLIINFLETSFPGLLNIPGFLLEFITPIIKVTINNRGRKQVIPFYNMPEFENWRATEGANSRWTLKYYKGLGTSTPLEARQYFSALDKHLKRFHALQEDDKQYIDLAFSKKKADDRKDWLQAFQPGTHLDPNLTEIPISDFINQELILFSMADNVRSIPSVLDGFKPGQRKVLYGCFLRNLKSEIKVSQLSGYVSEKTGYHHGEQSLVQTIIGLAQNFVGSNNINLLKPNGAFGTRAAGGKDFSAARYIFTEITKITRTIFNPLDNPLYTYVQDDEQSVEPEWYLPVIPMLLVNGTEGIGTGWSTNIPSFNPMDLVDNIRRLMNGEPMEEMIPWYKGWEGLIEPNGPDKYKVIGRIEQLDETTLEISEIPVKTWTNNVKEFLLAGFGTDKTPAWIKDMEEQHGLNIKFIIKLSPEEMAKALKVGLLEKFKLISSISMSNMVAFDPLGRIKRYSSAQEILRDFYYVRLEYYQKRKDFMMEQLRNQLTKLSEQARFIKLIIDKKLTISNRKRIDLVRNLEELKFVKFNKDNKPVKDVADDSLFVKAEEEIEEEEAEVGDVSQLLMGGVQTNQDSNVHKPETIYALYNYLVGMSMWSLTKDRYDKLLQEKSEKENELTDLLKKSAKDLWNEDLDSFVEEWEKFLEADLRERMDMVPNKSTKTKAKRPRAIVAKPSKSASSTTTVKKETEIDEPVRKKAATNAAKSKASSSTSSSTPLPEVKKEIKKEAPDVLSFFTQSSASSTPKSYSSKSKKPILVSNFSDSDDDVLLGLSNESTPKKAPPPKKKSEPVVKKSKPKAGSKAALMDELEELGVTEISKAPRSRPAKKITYTTIDSDEEEEEEEDDDVDMEDEDDEYEED